MPVGLPSNFLHARSHIVHLYSLYVEYAPTPLVIVSAPYIACWAGNLAESISLPRHVVFFLHMPPRHSVSSVARAGGVQIWTNLRNVTFTVLVKPPAPETHTLVLYIALTLGMNSPGPPSSGLLSRDLNKGNVLSSRQDAFPIFLIGVRSYLANRRTVTILAREQDLQSCRHHPDSLYLQARGPDMKLTSCESDCTQRAGTANLPSRPRLLLAAGAVCVT